MAGRGSFIESFPLFGFDLQDYDALFAEKLDWLLNIRDNERVTWNGTLRAPLHNMAVYPRPIQNPLPIWLAVGGNPPSVVRAATLGLLATANARAVRNITHFAGRVVCWQPAGNHRQDSLSARHFRTSALSCANWHGHYHTRANHAFHRAVWFGSGSGRAQGTGWCCPLSRSFASVERRTLRHKNSRSVCLQTFHARLSAHGDHTALRSRDVVHQALLPTSLLPELSCRGCGRQEECQPCICRGARESLSQREIQ